MNIQGLDYNTHREKLRLSEYGRDIQQMVEYCIGIEDAEERQACAEAIVAAMENLKPELRQQPDYRRKLWDHLAIMSNFQLDIEYPYDVSTAQKVSEKPQPLHYPKRRIPLRHYGSLVFKTLDRICEMEPGEERDALIKLVGNQMKRDLILYGNASPDNERIVTDIARFTDGKIQIDLNEFKFDYIKIDEKQQQQGKKKKK